MEDSAQRSRRKAEQVAGVIVAGGSSTRMGFDKLWADLAGKPLVAWSLLAFSECEAIDQLVLVASSDNLVKAEELVRDLAIEAEVVLGGAARRDSVLAGLELTEGRWVVIHDAARPLVESDLIVRGLEAARETGAAIAGMPETSTIKRVQGGEIIETLDREALWAAQTPQVFRRELLLEAHRRAGGPATDDAVLVEALGVKVRVYEGAYANIKVTTPVDLQLAALLLSARRGFRPAAGAN